ncbi:hypothetical protein FA95DRAFT_1566678 [Auriscalpium vulgare]|uniref:Uncharacterized protein n=1 Tax=Auriscalpium vulgare TaxID=40419 RepID=A0ACB8R961_9AGAM|nr:hypothetical protein FA95DRAFT_1566678 [Auriscalpium vulgare]
MLSSLTIGGPLLSCAHILRHIDVPASSQIAILPHCPTARSEQDLTTVFDLILTWLSRHALLTPSAAYISTVRPNRSSRNKNYIKEEAWHTLNVSIEPPNSGVRTRGVRDADVTICLQPSTSPALSWQDSGMAEARYGLCTSPHLTQLSLVVDASLQETWWEILDAPACVDVARLVSLGLSSPSGTSL